MVTFQDVVVSPENVVGAVGEGFKGQPDSKELI